ncbi:hypothetical protein A3G14_03730 [Candidatus Curtissbacteria bacterium RIFCSPLOWO2_12_FULL_38_9]|uniref:Peptidase S9 prolyl oligopeptidase catalytic domain-containing protein n=2 Tax=Candidatus Curtissiibacteriota TaxID=1752717 RepID=A0A1F5G8V4_9BACT|nr:MAG: hypothetical protein A3D04_03420 [Candidatus Curtissbacteria bacterium RIFCSPHIGHO2_02_FULL_40_16b]OGE14006.1 MAG: hypothetical protein A3G14_03730 [Candidatus Curtissbacteria bacterium RIFCSPLOWO2_12_FULL_38_9]
MFDYIKNRDGKKIFAVVDHPKRDGSFPAVLIIHGFKGFSSQRHIQGISDSLVDKGFLTLRPDLTKDPGRSYLDFSDMTYGQELRDAEDVLDYLLKLDEVDQQKIAVAGHSLAGMIAAELAAKREVIKALAILSGVYDFKWIANKIFKKPFQRAIKDFKTKGFTTVWSKELETRLQIKKSFYEDVFERSSNNFTADIKCPTLIISSENDESVSQSHADKYLRTIASVDKQMEIIKGSDHNYSGESLDKVKKEVANWFVNKLNKGSP